MRKILLIALMPALLASCASNNAFLSRNDPVAEFLNAERQLNECGNAWQKTELQDPEVRRTLFLGRDDPDMLLKLTNKEPIPDLIKEKFVKWYPLIVNCRSEFLNSVKSSDNRIVQVWLEYFKNSDDRALKLLNGEFKSIGELNQYSRNLIDAAYAERSRVVSILNNEIQQANAYRQQQQAIMNQQMIQSWAQNQQRNNQTIMEMMKPPIQTNCNVMGSWVNCTTR